MPRLLEPSIAPPATRSDLKLSRHTMLVQTSVLAAVCVVAFVVGLGSTPFWEPDEPRFAAATREMVRSGDYLEPTFNALPRWEKPVLLYWLQAVPMRLGLGPELSARLPAALSGLVATIGIYLLGLVWWSSRAGFVAAAMFATSFRVATYARQGLTDMPALATIVFTFLAFEISASEAARPWRRSAWGAAWCLVGLTALIKGPLAVIVPAVWLTTTQFTRPGSLRWRSVAAGALLASAIGGSWLAYMTAAQGTSFLAMHIGYEIVQRFADPSFPGKSRGPLFFWQILAGELAPWSLVVLAAFAVVVWHWRRLGDEPRRHAVLAVSWFIGVMLLCSASRYKLPHYALPAYPAAFLLAGLAVDRLAGNTTRRVIRIALAVTAAALVLAGAVAIAAPGLIPPEFATGAVVAGFALVAAGAVGLRMLKRGLEPAVLALAGGLAAAYAAVALLVLPPLADLAYPYPALGRLVAERASPSTTLDAVGVHTALVYYADRPVTFVDTPGAAAQRLDSPEPRLAVMGDHDFAQVRAVVSSPLTVIASRRQRNPRFSHVIDGRFARGTGDVFLVGNDAAARSMAR